MTNRLVLLTATALLISSCDTGKENANGTSSEAAASVTSEADAELRTCWPSRAIQETERTEANRTGRA